METPTQARRASSALAILGGREMRRLQAKQQNAETRRLVQTWKSSLGGLRGWRRIQDGEDGGSYIGGINGQPIAVIWSIAVETDGQPWLHVSLSHQSRTPTWSEVAEVKHLFVGDLLYAAQVHPPVEKYVNLNPHVLHLWAALTTWPLPEFSAVVEGTRTI